MSLKMETTLVSLQKNSTNQEIPSSPSTSGDQDKIALKELLLDGKLHTVEEYNKTLYDFNFGSMKTSESSHKEGESTTDLATNKQQLHENTKDKYKKILSYFNFGSMKKFIISEEEEEEEEEDLEILTNQILTLQHSFEILAKSIQTKIFKSTENLKNQSQSIMAEIRENGQNQLNIVKAASKRSIKTMEETANLYKQRIAEFTVNHQNLIKAMDLQSQIWNDQTRKLYAQQATLIDIKSIRKHSEGE